MQRKSSLFQPDAIETRQCGLKYVQQVAITFFKNFWNGLYWLNFALQAAAGGQEGLTIEKEAKIPGDSAREDLRGMVKRKDGSLIALAPIESKAKVAGYTSADPTGISAGINAENHGKVRFRCVVVSHGHAASSTA